MGAASRATGHRNAVLERAPVASQRPSGLNATVWIRDESGLLLELSVPDAFSRG